MLIWLYVAVGSALGGVSRYVIGGAMQQRFGIGFPLGSRHSHSEAEFDHVAWPDG